MRNKLILFTMIVFGFAFFTGCSQEPTGPRAIDVQAVANSLVEAGYVRMPATFEDEQAREIYLVDDQYVNEYAILKTGVSPGVGFIMIVEAKEDRIEEATANMQQVLQNEVGNAFYPDEIEAASQAELMVDGPYISLFILPAEIKDEAISMYKEALVVS